MEGGNDKSTLKPEIPKVVSCRFPATRLLRAQYSSLVHDRASQPLSARSLEKALAETEADGTCALFCVPCDAPHLSPCSEWSYKCTNGPADST